MTTAESPGSTSYHGHIDGLRAVAIALVLLFHFGFAGAAQGFLGVDIFFVISGFLIGGIVRTALVGGRFGIVDFYRRRIARIAPALLAVAAVTLAAGYWLLLPGDFARLAQEIRAASLSIANWFYEPQHDYMGRPRRDMLFLHSWSLSVEAQFYVAFPIAALLLHRFGLFRLPAILALLAASLAAYLLIGVGEPRYAFYFSSLRAWEFLTGVAIAVMPVRIWSPRVALVAAAAGALAMLIPAFVAMPLSFLPRAAWQLLCVAGTALLLAANLGAPANPVARLLSMPVIRGLGLISYSLYLVHWPLLMLAQYWHIEPLPPGWRLLLLLASLPLAWLGWFVVERPVRRWANRPGTSAIRVYGSALLAAGLVVAATTALIQARGFPDRLPERERALLAVRKERSACDPAPSPFVPAPGCLFGDRTVPPEIAIWGDSHSQQLGYVLGDELAGMNRSIARFTSPGCPPLIGANIAGHPDCTIVNNQIAADIAAMPSVTTVVLIAYYERHLGLGREPRLAALRRSVEAMRRAGKRVIIVGPLPKPHYNVPSGLVRRLWNDRGDVPTAISEREYRAQSATLRADFATLAAPGAVTIFDPGPALCRDGQCPYAIDGEPVYLDDNHVSLTGARRIARHMLPLLVLPDGRVAG